MLLLLLVGCIEMTLDEGILVEKILVEVILV